MCPRLAALQSTGPTCAWTFQPKSAALCAAAAAMLCCKQSHRYPAEHMAHASLIILERTDYFCSELSTVVIIQFL